MATWNSNTIVNQSQSQTDGSDRKCVRRKNGTIFVATVTSSGVDVHYAEDPYTTWTLETLTTNITTTTSTRVRLAYNVAHDLLAAYVWDSNSTEHRFFIRDDVTEVWAEHPETFTHSGVAQDADFIGVGDWWYFVRVTDDLSNVDIEIFRTDYQFNQSWSAAVDIVDQGNSISSIGKAWNGRVCLFEAAHGNGLLLAVAYVFNNGTDFDYRVNFINGSTFTALAVDFLDNNVSNDSNKVGHLTAIANVSGSGSEYWLAAKYPDETFTSRTRIAVYRRGSSAWGPPMLITSSHIDANQAFPSIGIWNSANPRPYVYWIGDGVGSNNDDVEFSFMLPVLNTWSHDSLTDSTTVYTRAYVFSSGPRNFQHVSSGSAVVTVTDGDLFEFREQTDGSGTIYGDMIIIEDTVEATDEPLSTFDINVSVSDTAEATDSPTGTNSTSNKTSDDTVLANDLATIGFDLAIDSVDDVVLVEDGASAFIEIDFIFGTEPNFTPEAAILDCGDWNDVQFITMAGPFNSPTVQIQISKPDFDDVRSLDTRVQTQRTSNNVLRTYKTGNAIQRFSWQWSALSRIKAEELYNFLKETSGDSIRIHDHENRQIKVVVLSESIDFVYRGFEGVSVGFDMEGNFI